MEKILFFILTSVTVLGQNQFMEVYYEESTYIDKNAYVNVVPDYMKKDFKHLLESEFPNDMINLEYVLKTDNDSSEYSIIQKIDNNQGGGINISNIIRSNKMNIYKDFLKNIVVENFNLFNNKYIVKDSIEKDQWFITDETISYKNNLLNKAIKNTKDQKIEAYFLSELKSNDGPNIYCGLPGLIFMIKIYDNSDKLIHLINLKEIKFLSKKGKFELPNISNSISREEYNNKIKEFTNR